MAASYWEKRFERLKKQEMRKADAVNADLARAYRDALRKLRADVEQWYDRFAAENDVSLARAREILDRRELAAFRMTLSDYIAEAKRLDLDADHIRALENASMRVRLTRAQEIYLKTAQHVEKLAKRQGLKLDGLMREVYTDATYRTAYETQKLKGFENFREVPARQIDAAVSRPWAPDGADFSARIWKQKKDLINNLQTDITRALMTGETTTDLAEQISKRFNTTYGQAYRLVETETAYIQERAMLDTYDALDIEKYEICAVLDSKTSETCQHLDGKIFDKKDAKPGVTMPPFHCHCRTTTIPYIEGVTDDGGRVARDSATGKSVRVENMTYEEWKAKYVKPEGELAGAVKDGIMKVPKTDADWEHMRRFETESECREYFDESLRAWDKNLDILEKIAVKSYSGDDYRDINGFLRGKNKLSEDDVAEVKKQIRRLDSALMQFELKDYIRLYRGRGTKTPVTTDMIGTVLEDDPAYQSSSLLKRVAEDFAGGKENPHVFEICMPPGKGRGAYIAPMSQYKGEQEFLIARGTKYKIIDVTTDGEITRVKLEVIINGG